MQNPEMSALEAFSNTIIGIWLGNMILGWFGIKGAKAWKLTLAFVIMSFTRSLLLRLLFNAI
jgi:hypothetical protein